MDTERVMERVRRLLAIANDPAASDNEQRIALEQAQRLMDRHAIEEWQLEEDHDDVEIVERRIRLETNPCNRYMAQLANIVAHGNRCRAAYECRRAGNGRDVVSTVWIYGARVDVDKTESIWTAMETSRAAMWRERARTTPRAKANAAWRNGYYRGFVRLQVGVHEGDELGAQPAEASPPRRGPHRRLPHRRRRGTPRTVRRDPGADALPSALR